MIDYDQFAEIYDIDMGYNMGEADIQFYMDYARNRSPVLELGCGTGRIMKPLMENQVRVLGIDISKKMLQRARHNLSESSNPGAYHLLCADISNFKLHVKFGLAICAFSTYSKLLKKSAQASFFDCLYRHMNDDAVFLLEMFVQDSKFQSIPDGKYIQDYMGRWYPAKKVWISRRKRIWKDVMPQVNKIELEYTFTNQNHEEEIFTLQDYTRYSSNKEIEALLKESGFKVKNIFSGYGKQRFTTKSNKMIFEARKPN